MLRFAVDEDFDNRIVRGVLRLLPTLDIVRVQDAGLLGERDSEVLEWAAGENRILLTHDASTMTNHAYARVESGRQMPGVFEVGQEIPIGEAIADLMLIATCSFGGPILGGTDLKGRQVFGPFCQSDKRTKVLQSVIVIPLTT